MRKELRVSLSMIPPIPLVATFPSVHPTAIPPSVSHKLHICFIKFHNSFHSRRKRADKFIFLFVPFCLLLNLRFFPCKNKKKALFVRLVFVLLPINGHKMAKATPRREYEIDKLSLQTQQNPSHFFCLNETVFLYHCRKSFSWASLNPVRPILVNVKCQHRLRHQWKLSGWKLSVVWSRRALDHRAMKSKL